MWVVDKIKVGGITYDVVYTEDISGFLYGSCNYEKGKILISSKTGEERQQQTLIHEMLHAIMFETGLTQEEEDEDREEEMVNRISLVLHQVLADNDFSFLRRDV